MSRSSSRRACTTRWFGERRRGTGADVRAGVQADQPEHPGGVGGQVAVGPGEDRLDRHRVVGGERREAQLLGGEFLHQQADRVVRVGGHALRRDAQRQRQMAAAAGQRADRVRLGGGALLADDLAQQRGRLLLGHGAERDSPVALDGEAAEPLAAGHHDAATRRRGQQRLQLRGVGGVVEHDQDPPVGEDRAVELGAGLEPGGDDVDLHAERGEELLQHLVDDAGLGVRASSRAGRRRAGRRSTGRPRCAPRAGPARSCPHRAARRWRRAAEYPARPRRTGSRTARTARPRGRRTWRPRPGAGPGAPGRPSTRRGR